MPRTASDWIAWAKAYADAADQMRQQPELQDVACVLLCHAIEASLKAYLLHEDRADLKRRIDHNLTKALAAAEGAGLARIFRITPDERQRVQAFGAWYAEPEAGPARVEATFEDGRVIEDRSQWLADFARRLLKAIEPRSARLEAQL